MNTTSMARAHGVISICVCTFKRPVGIRRALRSLLDMSRPSGWTIEFIVVDNDPSGSAAKAIEEEFPTGIPTDVRYFIESTSGVSHARNRCLLEAIGDLIGFIDDDEWVGQNWLIDHLATLDQHEADAVFGPVIPQFDKAIPVWSLTCGTYQRKQFQTGSELRWGDAQTNNTLFRRRMVESLGLRFSPHFASTGGEDSYFFAQAQEAGCKLIWCDSAKVTESVPESRMTRRWALERAFHGGRTYVRLHSARGMPFAYSYFAVYGLVYLTLLTPIWIVSACIGSNRQMPYALKLAGNLGKLFAKFYKSGKYGK